jgi:glutathione S-transferase
MAYAFPRAFADAEKRYPKLAALAAAVANRPNIARYLASERRLPLSEAGIFRYYPVLDQAAKR